MFVWVTNLAHEFILQWFPGTTVLVCVDALQGSHCHEAQKCNLKQVSRSTLKCKIPNQDSITGIAFRPSMEVFSVYMWCVGSKLRYRLSREPFVPFLDPFTKYCKRWKISKEPPRVSLTFLSLVAIFIFEKHRLFQSHVFGNRSSAPTLRLLSSRAWTSRVIVYPLFATPNKTSRIENACRSRIQHARRSTKDAFPQRSREGSEFFLIVNLKRKLPSASAIFPATNNKVAKKFVAGKPLYKFLFRFSCLFVVKKLFAPKASSYCS